MLALASVKVSALALAGDATRKLEEVGALGLYNQKEFSTVLLNEEIISQT